MAPGTADKKAEKSYLSSAVDSINPWAASRSTTPTQKIKPEEDGDLSAGPANPDDHSTTHLYGQSLRTYPSGCPPLKVQWFHAVDIPKRKPRLNRPAQAEKPPGKPKKYNAFSSSDSKALEAEYQKLLEEMENVRNRAPGTMNSISRKRKADAKENVTGDDTDTASGLSEPQSAGVRVAVNEDFLFDVDIEARELAPVYWLGPVYDVRRGTWFYQEGSNLRPCEENLAAQLEEGYLKNKPWLYPTRDRSPSRTRRILTPKASQENLCSPSNGTIEQQIQPQVPDASTTDSSPRGQAQPQSSRLFGTYMNSMATYHDANTAYLNTDGMLSWVTSSMYQRFSGGSYMSGVKLVRGFSEPSKNKEKESEKEKSTGNQLDISEQALSLDEKQQKMLKRRSAPPSTRASTEEPVREGETNNKNQNPRQSTLQRQLSSLLESEVKTKAEKEEEIRRREEQEIQDDYNALAGETQGREIEHLVLVTHGIGQLLSLRMESVNFVHDVNVLRKTIKSVYANSADLKALNSELGTGPGNCRVQVLPVCWRHLLDFPKKHEKKGERDLGDLDGDEDEYPSLEDITIEGVAFARSLISDLALDVLLYQSSYKAQISRIVLDESNRIFKLFKERNPDFKGKVHLMGHSLGSAILFDLLCHQKRDRPTEQKSPLRLWPAQDISETPNKDSELKLDFKVDDFFCLGSPIGLFQMLKGETIAARHNSLAGTLNNTHGTSVQEDLRTTPLGTGTEDVSSITGLSTSVASPKVQQLFNIFHPSDPISYRLEPLISPSMSALKPQLLPYTKRGIFGNVAPQGLTGIGAKVGQSVSGLWSSLSAGIASNLLNRSLGLSNEEVARLTANASQGDVTGSEATGAKITTIQAEASAAEKREATDARMRKLADSATGHTGLGPGEGDHNPTLIDEEIETLYSNFQKNRDQSTKDEDSTTTTSEEDKKARKMRKEEAKVRALNRNGRVDYSIQESVLDFNPINTIASHMAYWADEDVNHFVLSQLLSNRSGAKSKPGDILKEPI
ncbi:phosphatidic acid-preferring phospholipase [Fusarium heterosporum]|uniref:Phosphatidic acid-preferring phospholipase n=1 Tax=Fusarium heterosporum TaxID=42747 RepID=A0A8H5TPY4_FUSHE|nr:phosphatidic acid-preferring phospholipase [Fusarium heterosporum]